MPHPPRSVTELLQEIDDLRPGLRGEHVGVFAAGMGLIYAGTRTDSMLARLTLYGAGAALLGRALSGRDGVTRVMEKIRKLA